MSILPFILVFDLETVNPQLKTPTGLTDREGNYIPDQYQIYCSRIWQLGCVCQYGEFEILAHPGFPLENLSESSKRFLKREDRDILENIPTKQTLETMWPSFCKWLCDMAGHFADVILVAQQADHNDEIVLAVEMARYGLKWPSGMRIYAVDALYSIQQSFEGQDMSLKRSWGVGAIYNDLTGKTHDKSHRALEDAKCLLANIKTCWALQFMLKMGIRCPQTDFSKLSGEVENNAWVFWPTVKDILGWIPNTLKDHRKSIWSLTTMTRKGYSPWPPELAREMENKHDIYTISDFLERAKVKNFEAVLCGGPIVRKYWNTVEAELEYRKAQRSRTPSPERGPTKRVEMNGEMLLSLAHNNKKR